MNKNVASDVDFKDLISKILGLLTAKEKDVIERRFALKQEKKETLDFIGKSYSITRERVRQIESVAIQKLARISKDPSMQLVHTLAISILEENGNVMLEDMLVSEMIKSMGSPKVNINAIKFALRVSDKIIKQDKNQFVRNFLFIKDKNTIEDFKKCGKDIIKFIKSVNKSMDFSVISKALKSKYDAKMLKSLMYIDWNIMQTKTGEWGLKSWRFLNPRSICDCVLIILKEKKEPMYFRDVLQALLKKFPNKKRVSAQACHNELIRNDQFVLLGRGIYGLKEWGFAPGTVCDLIIKIFEENSQKPLKRQFIIEEVLKKREVRVGTISLNLQKYDFFQRVGRAVYEYNEKQDDRRRKKNK